MQKKDCILILGAGITREGSITPIGKARVEKGVECCTNEVASRILMSGAYPAKSSFIPVKTEAQLMKEYAIALGIPSQHILTEEYSKETLGNIFFSKQVLEAKNWKHILVVTSNFHLPRTEYLCKKIFGPEFTVEMLPSLTYLPVEELMGKIGKEKETLGVLKQDLDGVHEGDTKAIREYLARMPFYAELLKGKHHF